MRTMVLGLIFVSLLICGCHVDQSNKKPGVSTWQDPFLFKRLFSPAAEKKQMDIESLIKRLPPIESESEEDEMNIWR